MDVLELRCDCTGDDGLHLLRYSADASAQEGWSCAQLRGIPLPERRTGSDFCRPSARSATRLVSLRRVQRLALVRIVPLVVRAAAESTRFQSSCGTALSIELAHNFSCLPALLVSLRSLHRHYLHS